MQINTIDGYKEAFLEMQAIKDISERKSVLRQAMRTDLYFFIRFGLCRDDIEHKWLLDRCKEVYASPNDMLDLWAREHYKSSIITYALTMQDILASHGCDPLPKWGGVEPTFGIFSHTRPIAIGFLRQIKREFESNTVLKWLFDDILWQDAKKEAPKWSEYDGLVVKRSGNPKESTVEAWGVVESQPTGKHFTVRIYDDLVTVESVGTPASIQKTLERWEMSVNLGVDGGHERYIGTRYHFNDLYRVLMERKAVTPRIYPGTHDGTENGTPVLWTDERMEKRRRTVGKYTFATQILQNPLADESQVLPIEWIKYYDGDPKAASQGCNIYMLVDPANEKKKSSDYTAMWVIGLGEDGNYRVLDLVRDRLNLAERGDMVMRMHRRWKPLSLGYEKYGMQADIEYIKERMGRENYYFEIIPLGGNVAKMDRIRRLVPSLEEGRWLFPQSLFKNCMDGGNRNLVEEYITQEYSAFPVPVHDDMLDCQSRILDDEMNVLWPRMDHNEYERYSGKRGSRKGTAWAS